MHNMPIEIEKIRDQFITRKKCIVCGKDDYKIWSEEFGIPTVMCNGCGFVWSMEHMSTDIAKSYYNQYGESLHFSDDKMQMRKEQYKRDCEFVKRFSAGPAMVLDIGCSDGEFTKLFSGTNTSLYGIDLHCEALEKASDTGVIVSDDLKDFSDLKFDLIIFRGTLPHIADIDEHMKDICKVASDNCVVAVLATPNIRSFCARTYKEMWNLFDPIGHIFYFDHKTITQFMNNYDFKTVGIEFPYINTAYENMEEDYDQIVKDIASHKIDKPSPSFWGNMMNVCFKK